MLTKWKAGAILDQSHPWLHTELKACLGYVKLTKKIKKRKQEKMQIKEKIPIEKHVFVFPALQISCLVLIWSLILCF